MNSTTAKSLIANGIRVCLFVSTWAVQPILAQQKLPRIHLTQDQLCCFDMRIVNPTYPREARFARTEGVVKVVVVFADDGSVTELQAVSGDPLLLDSTIKRFAGGRFLSTVTQNRREIEVPLSFEFRIEDLPDPAYLHLTNGKVVRVDKVQEFTDRIEYTVGRRTHHLNPDLVTEINACARVTVIPQKEGDCIPGGGPSFFIHSIPLLRQ